MSDTLVTDHDLTNEVLLDAELSVEELLEALDAGPVGEDFDKTVHEARFGDELDGPGGCYIGARFNPRDVGLKARPTLDECAHKIVGARKITVRQRRLLRRYAVLSVLVAVTPREKLRAAARWVQAIHAAGAEMSGSDRRYATWQNELRIATNIFHECGAARLAAATAKKWRRGGNTCDFDDIRQAAALGMARAVLRYDHLKGAVSVFAEFKMSDEIAAVVRAYEHPHLPRSVFKNRRRILDYVQQCLEANPNCDRSSDFYEQVADKFGVKADAVEKIINGAKDVPLNAPARSLGSNESGSEGGAEDLGGVFADIGPTPFDVCAMDESVESLKRILAKHIDRESCEIIFRYEGIGQDVPEDLTSIGRSYDRSRTWAGGRRKRALATLVHPLALHEITGRECTPDELSDQVIDPASDRWQDRLTERQGYVARFVMGLGSTPLPGSVARRVTDAAEQLNVELGRVYQMVVQIIAVHPAGRDLVARDPNVRECLEAALDYRKKVSVIHQAAALPVAAQANAAAFTAEMVPLEGFEDEAAAS